MLLLIEVLSNYHFFSCDLLGISKYFYVNIRGIFFQCNFFGILSFLLLYITILGRDHMATWFYFKYIYLKEYYSVFKKSCHFDTVPYYLWKITSIEKIWTLVIFISWCLTDHMTIWTKFVDNNGDLLEYLLSVMWSFGHRSLSGCKNVRKLCFWWFWGMVAFSGANKITGFFLIFSLHFHT